MPLRRHQSGKTLLRREAFLGCGASRKDHREDPTWGSTRIRRTRTSAHRAHRAFSMGSQSRWPSHRSSSSGSWGESDWTERGSSSPWVPRCWRWRWSSVGTEAQPTPPRLALVLRRWPGRAHSGQSRLSFSDDFVDEDWKLGLGGQDARIAHPSRARTACRAGDCRTNDDRAGAALLHDLGLAAANGGQPRCFTLVGAEKAIELAREASWSAQAQLAVAEAIAAHMNVKVEALEGPEAHLLTAGAHLSEPDLRPGSIGSFALIGLPSPACEAARSGAAGA